MRWILVAFLGLACSGGGSSTPIPNITDPTCAWVEHAVLTYDGTECMHVVPWPGYEDDILFRRDGDETCEGVSCVLMRAGSVTVLGRVDAFDAYWDAEYGPCSEFPPCP